MPLQQYKFKSSASLSDVKQVWFASDASSAGSLKVVFAIFLKFIIHLI